jgi:hypothetical protein
MNRALARPILLAALVLIPACPADPEDEPREVVEGFLKAMNARDWDGMCARLAPETLESLGGDEDTLLLTKVRLFTLLDKLDGGVKYEILGQAHHGDGTADVPAKLSARPRIRMGTPALERTVSFRLKETPGGWKLVPELVLEDGTVLSSPMDFLGGGR